MFHGGTNFGFTSGAKYEKPNYLFVTTSYYFNAILDEAGDPTENYFKIKKLLKETVSFNKINKCMYIYFKL